jgi:hypothetical protein
MNYFWLKQNLNDEFQSIGFSQGTPKDKDGKPDLDQWGGGPKGKLIMVTKPPTVEIVKGTKERKRPDFYFMGGSFIIINEKIKRLLEGLVNQDVCQFVELLLKKKNKEEYLYAINPLINANCINKEKTEYKKGLFSDRVINPVLRKSDMPNTPIFFIFGFPRILIINQEIYELLTSVNPKGLNVQKVLAE